MRIFAEKYLENPYPEPVDDGTWEDDGGYVAQPNHAMYAMECGGGAGMYGKYISYPETVLIMHPLTFNEYRHNLPKIERSFK